MQQWRKPHHGARNSGAKVFFKTESTDFKPRTETTSFRPERKNMRIRISPESIGEKTKRKMKSTEKRNCFSWTLEGFGVEKLKQEFANFERSLTKAVNFFELRALKVNSTFFPSFFPFFPFLFFSVWFKRKSGSYPYLQVLYSTGIFLFFPFSYIFFKPMNLRKQAWRSEELRLCHWVHLSEFVMRTRSVWAGHTWTWFRFPVNSLNCHAPVLLIVPLKIIYRMYLI